MKIKISLNWLILVYKTTVFHLAYRMNKLNGLKQYTLSYYTYKSWMPSWKLRFYVSLDFLQNKRL